MTHIAIGIYMDLHKVSILIELLTTTNHDIITMDYPGKYNWGAPRLVIRVSEDIENFKKIKEELNEYFLTAASRNIAGGIDIRLRINHKFEETLKEFENGLL